MEPAPDDSSPGRPRLDVVQIAAGALASVTAAVIGSRLGVNGTVIGAAVGSIVGSVGSESYAHFLGRTASRVSTVASTSERVDRTQSSATTTVIPLEAPDRERGERTGQQPLWDTGPQPAAPADEPTRTPHQGSEVDAAAADVRVAPSPPRRLPLRAAVLAAAATFVLALAALTAFELLSGRPVSTITGGSTGGGTTLSDLFDAPPTSPAPTGSPSPTATGTSTTPELPSPSPTAPTRPPTATPTTTLTATPSSSPTETATSTPSTALPSRLPLEGVG